MLTHPGRWIKKTRFQRQTTAAAPKQVGTHLEEPGRFDPFLVRIFFLAGSEDPLFDPFKKLLTLVEDRFFWE